MFKLVSRYICNLRYIFMMVKEHWYVVKTACYRWICFNLWFQEWRVWQLFPLLWKLSGSGLQNLLRSTWFQVMGSWCKRQCYQHTAVESTSWRSASRQNSFPQVYCFSICQPLQLGSGWVSGIRSAQMRAAERAPALHTGVNRRGQ